ncbi:MAG: response regulator [Selenomonadaceae bacterium]|nr:response regulator [Selenomonadaceae bacterium]
MALVAEDNDINAEIIEFMLGKYGIETVLAEKGQVTVDTFAESKLHEYDVIFMDIMMPVMGGIEAARAIRGLGSEDAKAVPIFAMTANAFADDVQRSIEAGMNEHLTKPLQEGEIIKAINKYIKK